MDDEFKLCWKNFQDNIASGFQNLYDRGDLVDVTLACDGKLLHAHKIVLAICSPYFQEIFITNPCKHPIIILKDVTFNIMCELLEFMYQGVVNVKHTELQSFMKIGQLLQIKGLATNTSSSAPSTSSEKSTSQTQNAEEPCGNFSDTANNGNAKNTITPSETTTGESCSSAKLSNITTQSGLVKSQSPSSSPTPTATATPTPTPTPMSFTTSLTQQSFKNSPENNLSLHHLYHSGSGVKRHPDYNTDALSIRKQFRRSIPSADNNNELNDSTEGGNIDQVNAEEFFLSSLPHISSTASPAAVSLRNSLGPTAFGFDYNMYKGSSTSSGGGSEYPNDLHLPSDYSKNFGNHMDIPPSGSNVVMLSSTSLLHGNCVFNRNNTVATQQGMKTYWLCKSYRISMCRARCITHQGRVISATGVHNHPPHMRGSSGNGTSSSTSAGGYGDSASQAAGQSVGISALPTSVAITPSANNNNTGVNSRLHQPTSSSLFQHNLHGLPSHTHQHQVQQHHQNQQHQQHHHHQHQQHQQQQQHHPPSISPPPPPSASLITSSHTHPLHYQQPLPNLLVQHHSNTLDNNQGNLQQHHHLVGNSSGQNSVIQNMMQNVNMMHLPNLPPMLTIHSNQQHSPNMSSDQAQHPSSVGSSLEITPLIESSPDMHMPSPSNRSNPSHQGGKSISSPLAPHGVGVGSVVGIEGNGAAALKSPVQRSINNSSQIDDQHVLVRNVAMSPTEINSNTAGSTEASASSQQSDSGSNPNEAAHHQAHVIDSITISPASGHNFKIEDM